MANYTAADIKALREQTGAGMLDVKKALDEAEGDKSKAQELLRIKGLKGVTKREGRSASNGLVAAAVEGGVGTMLEINCETDFVAKGDKFIALADKVLAHAAEQGLDSADALRAAAGDREVFGVLVQYPGADGRITDWRALADAAHEVGALVTAAADLLALTLLTPPGEWGA